MTTQVTDELVIQKNEVDGVNVFVVSGDLIITSAKGLQKEVEKSILEGKNKIVFDFISIDYIDAFGIGVVVKTQSEVEKRKGKFAIILNQTLFELFEKCHLDDYLQVFIRGDEDKTDKVRREALEWARS